MRTAVLAVTLLLSSPALVLASPAQSDAVFRLQSVSNGCPVAFAVQRTSPIELVNAADASRHRGSQRIHLAFDPLGTSGIQRAEISVYGASATPHLLPAVQAATSRDIHRNFHLSGPNLSGLRETTLWVDDVSSILSVDLLSITYVDGSTWRQSSGSVCRAVPSLLLPVAAESVVRK